MINVFNEKLKIKFLNFIGITKNVVLKNNYMVIKVYSLKGVRNIEKFIEKKLEAHLGELKDLLIHYKVFKINKEKRIAVYILKDSGELKNILRENLKVKLNPIQIKRADNIKKKFKLKSGIIILKDKNIFYVMSFAKEILINYEEISYLEDINIEFQKEYLEKIIKEEPYEIYISKEILEENKLDLEELNLTVLGV